MVTPETFIKAQLAMTAYREGSYAGGIDTMKAIAFVIRNRVRAGWHNSDWMQVIEATDEYRAQAAPRTAPAVPIRDVSFRMFLQSIDDIFTGLAPDPYTEGALYYGELREVERDWFREIIRDHQRVASVGPLEFFK